MEGAAAYPRMLQCVPRFVQDLERRDCRRKCLHVAAGGPDDLTDGRRCRASARCGRVMDRLGKFRWSISSPATIAMFCRPGELLRSIHLPAAALTQRSAMRQCSLTKLGRSAALFIGTSGPCAATCCLPSPRRPIARCSFAFRKPVRGRTAQQRSMPRSRRRAGSRTCTGRHPTSGTSPLFSEEIRAELAKGEGA